MARLERGTLIYQWVVDECPICGKEHRHTGGVITGDPYRFLGERVGHCSKRIPRTVYELVPSE